MLSQRIVITGAEPRPPYSALSAHQSAQAGLAPLRPWRRDERLREEQRADALAAALR